MPFLSLLHPRTCALHFNAAKPYALPRSGLERGLVQLRLPQFLQRELPLCALTDTELEHERVRRELESEKHQLQHWLALMISPAQKPED